MTLGTIAIRAARYCTISLTISTMRAISFQILCAEAFETITASNKFRKNWGGNEATRIITVFAILKIRSHHAFELTIFLATIFVFSTCVTTTPAIILKWYAIAITTPFRLVANSTAYPTVLRVNVRIDPGARTIGERKLGEPVLEIQGSASSL